MKITLHPTEQKYINAKKNLVFRYIVTGTPEELADYKAVKGAFVREDTQKNILFFTTRGIGQEGQLRKTSDGKDYVVDDTEEAMFASLAKQYGIEWACVKMNKALPGQAIPVVEEKK